MENSEKGSEKSSEKSLELRLTEIEKKLDMLTQRAPTAGLSKEDIEAYRRVRDVMAADWGEFCGINDCFRCIQLCGVRCLTTRCIVRCINECVCGPCNIGGGLGGGIGRFEGLGE